LTDWGVIIPKFIDDENLKEFLLEEMRHTEELERHYIPTKISEFKSNKYFVV